MAATDVEFNMCSQSEILPASLLSQLFYQIIFWEGGVILKADVTLRVDQQPSQVLINVSTATFLSSQLLECALILILLTS